MTLGERPGGHILLLRLRGDKSVGEGTPAMMIAPLSLRGDGLLASWALKAE